jgi:hypothetical protein
MYNKYGKQRPRIDNFGGNAYRPRLDMGCRAIEEEEYVQYFKTSDSINLKKCFINSLISIFHSWCIPPKNSWHTFLKHCTEQQFYSKLIL